ncbi:huntingtin-interacting protein M-like [Heterocephalus glaber]|uniref:Huntingtin-interacting protein M-like n=1 Tax=Heterocephalus glaber TaxID=10181 RepID=A0AAX6TCB2_HETGA|nr:huntingtin-interacting protein M-like [Heterocephalus glaber]
MSEKKSQECSYKDNNQQENPDSRPELQLSVSYVYHFLKEKQYTPCSGSTTTDFLLATLASPTDYILQLAGML